ncbi:MAG: hypothetical protein WBP34_18235 [Thermoanaerobaculia bacterium]
MPFRINIRTPLVVLLSLSLAGCPSVEPQGDPMDEIAESFVKLVLAVGQHDADYVDAYFGPEEWQLEAQESALPLDEIRKGAVGTLETLRSLQPAGDDPLAAARHLFLGKSLESLLARVDLLSGVPMTFDQESAALYDAVAPTFSAEHFQGVLDKLDDRLPGEGSILERFNAFQQDFVIPPEHLDDVFQAAIEACREETRKFIELPSDESFTVEYVTDKSWSGYNWYKGGYQSLIQVNTDLPIYIDRALDLACHEGYPGHHVYNLLLEREMVNELGWMEFTIYPLFSPRSFLAEGTANFGIDVAFPSDKRLELEETVLFPLASLDPQRARDYYEIQDLAKQLRFAGNEAARGYLDGNMDAEEAIDWLTTYSMMSRPRAEQRLRFIEQYRSYVINYNLGQEMVGRYIEGHGGTQDRPGERWRLFSDLISRPAVASELD